MVKHVVLWTFKEGTDKDAAFAQLAAGFKAFTNEVPGMASFAFHRGFGGWDVCLESTHDSREALEAYQAFPAHTAIKEVVKTTRALRASCDFEL